MEFCPVLLADLKAEARREALARRATLDPTLGAALVHVVLGGMPPPAGAVVAGFWPMGQEIDLRLGAANARFGLPIARNILRAHGGDVVLRNRPQGGLAAIMTLPA